MTQVYIFAEEGGMQVRDFPQSPEQITTAINQGKWEDYLGYDPAATKAWQATRVGRQVLVLSPPPLTILPEIKPTPREYQILQCLCGGETVDQAAYQLHIDKRTVRYHLVRLRDRLKARTNAELLARAVALGLVRPELDDLFD